ncbi:RING finger protein [Coniochaeta sp. 2T2.1]|nr:RING finger protein [Coniochaeta sp. 2T2.1]
MEDSDDQRDVELSSLSAIFPEIQRVNDDDPYTIFLDVPVNPSNGVVVSFPAAAADGVAPPANGAAPADYAAALNHGLNQNNNDPEEQRLSHLPPVRLQISLSPGYPADEPPRISISTSPPWLPDDVVRRLEEDGPRLWEEMGRDIVVFTYIDHVQQSAEDIFGLVNEKDALEVDLQHKISILDYDIKAKRAAFERETFECGVCLDPKRGSVCHRMLDCGHVFCVECLQDFYNNAIKEGDLATVRCLAPNCAKEREEKAAQGKKSRGKKIRTFISPSELLQIPLDQSVVERYVTLKYKTELESDKDTIYCPRSWCGGAARSKKHKKPEGLQLAEESDDDSEPDGENWDIKKVRKPTSQDLIAVCEDCGFAFCSRCRQSWHGEFYICQGPRKPEELSEEEKASLEYVRLHSTPCPQCGAPAQKTHGCNHMICYRCRSHFCYLCSAWLDPVNPYQHFNEMPGGKITGCYMRLWELEHGDGDDVDYGFAGGARRPDPQPEQEQPQAPEPGRIVAVVEEPDEVRVRGEEIVFGQRRRDGENGNNDGNQPQQNGQPVAVAREGPLVLRIAGNQPAGAGRGGPRGGHAPPVPAAPARGGRQAHLRGGQAGLRGGRGGRAGARAGGPGGDGRRGGGNAGRGAAHRQNIRGGQGFQQRHNAAAAAHGHVAADVEQAAFLPEELMDGALEGGDWDVEDGGDLDAVQRAWVRQFVQLALNDQEDVLLGFDSDSD